MSSAPAKAASAPAPAPTVLGPSKKNVDFEINKLFKLQIKHEASDLHLQVGKPPILRIKGSLRELSMPPISEELMWKMFNEVMDDRNKRIMAETGGADFAHVVPYEGANWRFRVNLLKQLGQPGMVARKVEQNIPNFEGLYLPSGDGRTLQVRPGNGAAGGRDRFGKEYDDRVDARLGESQRAVSHPHDRRPDRIRLHGRQVPDQSARDRHGCDRLPCRDEARRPRRSRHHARGRNARPGNLRNRHPRGRDRTPRVRNDSRLRGAFDNRSYSRPLPARHAQGDSLQHGFQHERHRRAETAPHDLANHVACRSSRS